MTAAASEPFDHDPFPLPLPCKKCGADVGDPGLLTTRGGQDICECARCGQYNKAVPKTETGRAVRTLRSNLTIPPSQRHRVMQSYGNRCVACGRGPADGIRLEIDHVIPVLVGRAQGLTDAQLNHDDNLVPLCAEDNNGKNYEPMRLGFAIALFRAREHYRRTTGRDPADDGRLL